MAYFKHICVVEAPQSLVPPIPRFISDAIGVCYLASAVKSKVESIVMPENYFNEAVFDSFERLLKHHPVDFVGISAMTGGFNNAVQLASIAKKYGIFVAMGGFHPTSLPEEVLNLECVDVVVIGEGEETFRELVIHGPSKNVRGLAFMAGGGIVFTGRRPVIDTIDSIAFPMRSLRPRRFGEKGSEYSIDTIYTSRGCPWTCSFCANDQMHKKWRGRSPENVIEELAMLHHPKIKKHIKIWDANFLTNIKRAEKICDLLIERGLTNFKFGSESRVKDIIRAERILGKLRKVGLHLIGLGIESPNAKTLEHMKKNNMLEDVGKAIELCKKYGISTEGYFIIGHHSETVEDTLIYPEYAKSIGLSKSIFMVMTPYPGTEIFREYKNENKIVSYDWDLYNNFSPVVSSHNMNQITVVKMMVYCFISFSGYRSILRKKSVYGIVMELLSRFFTLTLFMKTNKTLTEKVFLDCFHDAFIMFHSRNPSIELEKSSFSEKIWKEPITIRLDLGPKKAIELVFEQHGTKRAMSIIVNKSPSNTPNAVIRMGDLISYSGSLSVDWFISLVCTGEIIRNNQQLMFNSVKFLKQQASLLASPMLWHALGSAVSIYSESLIKR